MATGIIAVSSSLLGAVVGGLIAHRTQMQGMRYQRERYNQEQDRQLKDRIIMFVMTTLRIRADLTNVSARIAYYKKAAAPHTMLWEAVHFIVVVKAYEPSLTHLDPIAQLKSSGLLTDCMWIYSEYSTIISLVSDYNLLRTRYMELRKVEPEDSPELGKIAVNMQQHVEFIDQEINEVIDRIGKVESNLYRICEKHFGSAAFLRLGK